MEKTQKFLGQYGINIIGWVLTVIMSAFGAWSAMNARMYELDKRLSILDQEISLEKQINEQQDKMILKIDDLFNQINLNISSLKDTKADRKYYN